VTLYCHELNDNLCCSSCHYEWDDGYGEPFETEIAPGIVFSSCCRKNALDPSRETALKIIWQRRHKK